MRFLLNDIIIQESFFKDIGNEYKTYTESKRKLDGSFKSLWEEMQDLGNVS